MMIIASSGSLHPMVLHNPLIPHHFSFIKIVYKKEKNKRLSENMNKNEKETET